MQDIILHIPDLQAFRSEGNELALKGDTLFSFYDGKLTFNIEKIPVHYNENESICLVKGLDSDVKRLKTVEKLGVCINKEYIYDTPECEATYDRVNGSLEFNDLEGNKHFRPKIIGVFA